MSGVLLKDVITIDGPSGAGKSTIARRCAEALGYRYLDTGALYRAVAWKFMHDREDPADDAALKKVLAGLEISLNAGKVLVNGKDVTSLIRTAEMGEMSSRVSAKPLVRQFLYQVQREAGLEGRVVVEGRDTGTTIFPEAPHKFYLDADIEERARRRYEELKSRGSPITFQETLEDLKKRDRRDSGRKAAPLQQTEDMTYIDSTGLSIDEVVNRIVQEVRK